MLRGETQYNPVSRFLREIPANLLDNKPPTYKRYDEEEYRDDSYERVMFKQKPYASSYGSKPTTTYKPYTSQASVVKTYTPAQKAEQQYSAPKSPYQSVYKPKAVPKKPETKAEVKPFLTKGSLSGIAGVSKGMPVAGQKPDYDIGDRVSHIKFGEGKVTNMVKGPKDYQVTVEFDNYGQKIMLAAFAKFQKIEP